MAGPAGRRDNRGTRSNADMHGGGLRRRGVLVNAMSVDIEDYFHVSAFTDHIDRSDWDNRPTRVVRNVELILELFRAHDVRGTFFVLGWVAERHPGLVRRIVDGGHELASHGFGHVKIHRQTPTEFRADVRATRLLLEDIGGVQVKGYRAPSFSIGADTMWAFNVLEEEGYKYSSSVYPIRHDHYGMPEAPRFAFKPLDSIDILECPVSTLPLLGRNLPCGGGGYFRLLPYATSRWAMRRVNRLDEKPCVFYFHPWEIDPDQPRVPGLSLKTRVRHYINLDRMRGRLRSVLADFAWDRMDRIFLGAGANGDGPG